MIDKDPDPAAALITHALEVLDRTGVQHRVLRNHAFLSRGVPYDSRDVDLLVARQDGSSADRVLKRAGFVRTHDSTVRRHVGYAAYVSETNQIVAIDLHLGDATWNDIPYLPGHILLDRTGGRPPWVDHPPLVSALLVLHSILDKKHLKQDYAAILDRYLENGLDLDDVRSTISWGTGSGLAARLVDRLQARDYEGLLRLRSRVILAVVGRQPHRWPGLLACLLRSRLRGLLQTLGKKTAIVALVGPDGVGKSTVGNAVSERLRACGIAVRRFYMGRWHSHVLPLAALATRHGSTAGSDAGAERAGDPTAASDPVRIEGRPVYRLIRDAAYLVEMLARYAVRLWPAARRPGIVLTDRYAYDLVLDPNATPITSLFLTHAYPRPDVCIYLQADIDTLLARKSEQSRAEMERQLREYGRWQSVFGMVPVMSDDIDLTTDRIVSLIMRKYLERI